MPTSAPFPYILQVYGPEQKDSEPCPYALLSSRMDGHRWGDVLFLCFVLFFSGGKLNEGVCMHYYDFHNLVEQSLGKTKSWGEHRESKKDSF